MRLQIFVINLARRRDRRAWMEQVRCAGVAKEPHREQKSPTKEPY